MLGIAAWMLLAGCSATEPTPASPPTGLDAPPAEPAAPALPPRPSDVPIDALDPCAAFTAAQLRILGVATPEFVDDVDGRGARCRWSSTEEPLEAYVVARVTTAGAAASLDSVRGAQVVTIAGFPAVETQGLTAPRDSHCIVLVDVFEGQSLLVQYDFSGFVLDMTRPLACEKARAAAELAMDTVVATV